MRVSLKWLRELVDVDIPVEELAELLDMTGTAVESIEKVGEGLEGVVVGQILTKEKHPNADKLWVTTVDIGAERPLDIVCGAQNFEAGDKVPVATVGTTLPNGMKIRKAKLRGEVSEGMNCSPAELGMGEDHSGLMILEPDAPVGMPFAEYRGLSDTVIELEVTPNRPDCLSMAGVAREVAAITSKTSTVPSQTPPESGKPVTDSVRVTIDDPDLCPRYTARLIEGVSVGPSPEWLTAKLIAAGQRPVNNIVDITNYVMFELGQPLHAFDAATIGKDEDGRSHVIVRCATTGEKLVTLDGQERDLDERTLLICGPTGPIALAGVMGGEHTEVSENTVDILLESASFDNASISRTSRSLGLISEASLRFERGVDPNGCVAAIDRAAALMAEICGGKVASGVVDEYPRPLRPRLLTLRVARLNAILGTRIPADEVAGILTRLGMTVTGEGETLEVSVPTFRPDLEREIDLVEEVVRVWGMERVEPTKPGGRDRVGHLTEEQRWHERIGNALRAAGLNETMTYSFGDEKDPERMGIVPAEDERPVRLLNPMSEDQSVMRRTIAPGLIRSVAYNQHRDVDNVHLYEMGKVFFSREGEKLPAESLMVCGLLAGRWNLPAWNDPPEAGDLPGADLRSPQLHFFDGKGVIESLMEELGIERWSLKAEEYPWLQPGRSSSVMVGKTVAGWLGEIHPHALEAFEAEGPVTMFELDVDVLVRNAVTVKGYKDIPRFPAVELDIALLVDKDVSYERVVRAISSSGGKILDSVRLFDVYEGPGVPDGKKSLAFALLYRAPDRTLTDEEVRPVHEKLLRKVTSAVGAQLRS